MVSHLILTHQDPHLLLPKESPKHAGQGEPHAELVRDGLKDDK